MQKRKIQPLKFGEQTIYIEVSDVNEFGKADAEKDRFEQVNAIDEIKESGSQVHGTIKALSETVQSALADAQPNEWSLEINLGFKGKSGIPFIAEGEANGSVKVTAKWNKSWHGPQRFSCQCMERWRKSWGIHRQRFFLFRHPCC